MYLMYLMFKICLKFNFGVLIMGKKLLDYYEKAAHLGGLKAKMRLAIITKIPSTKAPAEPDSAENIALFEKAMQEIKKEF